MTPRFLLAVFLLASVPAARGADLPKPLVEGLKRPASVAVGQGGKLFITVKGEKEGEGAVLLVDKDKTVPFATGLIDPEGIAAFQQFLFVADKNRVMRIDPKGTATVLAPAEAFPSPPGSLGGIVADPESGMLYLTDFGEAPKQGGAVYSVTPKGKVTLVVRGNKPTGIVMDGASHVIIAESEKGQLFRIKLADGSTEKIADGPPGCRGMAWDHHGRLFVGDGLQGQITVIPRPGQMPVLMAKGFKSAWGLCLGPSGKHLLAVDFKAGTLTELPITIPGSEVDERPLPLDTPVAFPDLKWAGWKPETDKGKPNPLRPIVLTHAGDGSNRVFVATEQGVIHVFPNDPKAKATKVFLDIQDRVTYRDDQNEEGLLGLAFHPKHKQNGEFFVFYTTRKSKMTNVVSRFKVRKDDPDRADPNSEEILLQIQKPYWNHDGGTLCFGPDGYLYLTHGDGGLANDPHENGQNLGTLLGKVLRIDVDRKDGDLKYAIPKDNPFVGKKDVRPEIWAYGLRNIWRMSFDRKTGKLWAGDVGQNLYEEIDIIERAGNYGWNVREGLHPFGAKGSGPKKELIDPIWEYHHDLGKCIIGGHVYRGDKVPELQGYYIYADYITSRMWALKYDEGKKRVVENRVIKDLSRSILSFGEDENGEVYMLTLTADGKGLFRFGK